MAVSKKILITTESHEVFILRTGSSQSFRGFCAACGGEVDLVTLDQAVSMSGISAKEIFRHAEADLIHTIETNRKHLLICTSSMGAAFGFFK